MTVTTTDTGSRYQMQQLCSGREVCYLVFIWLLCNNKHFTREYCCTASKHSGLNWFSCHDKKKKVLSSYKVSALCEYDA